MTLITYIIIINKSLATLCFKCEIIYNNSIVNSYIKLIDLLDNIKE